MSKGSGLLLQNSMIGGDFLRCCDPRSSACIAFAAGMLVAALFPYTIAIVVIAAVLIIAGLSLSRY